MKGVLNWYWRLRLFFLLALYKLKTHLKKRRKKVRFNEIILWHCAYGGYSKALQYSASSWVISSTFYGALYSPYSRFFHCLRWYYVLSCVQHPFVSTQSSTPFPIFLSLSPWCFQEFTIFWICVKNGPNHWLGKKSVQKKKTKSYYKPLNTCGASKEKRHTT